MIKQRLCGLLLCIGVLFSLSSAAAPEVSAAAAREITAGCAITAPQESTGLSTIWDNDVATAFCASGGVMLSIQSDIPMGGVYLLWYAASANWTLYAADDSGQQTAVASGDSQGFLHEFVALAEPTCQLTLEVDAAGATLSEIHIFEPGEPPTWVQRWQPMLDKADMLVYSTHADDEHLWFGGTMPVYAGEYNKKVQVAYLIRHGAARNEYFREHELLDGLWTVGITNYPMVSNFEDYFCKSLERAKEIYDDEAVMAYTVMLLRRFKPEVVVGHDLKGEYGHGVHMLCADSLARAIPLSGDAAYYPDSAAQYGTWSIKKCYLHLYERNTITMDWNVPLSRFGGRTGLDMAKEGYQCHKSQLKKWFRVEGEGSAYDCRRFGLYYSAVGADVEKNDFFENIDPVIPITTPPSTTTTTNTTAPSTTTTTTLSTTTTTITKPTTTTIQPVNHAVNITVATTMPPAGYPVRRPLLTILALICCLAAAGSTGYLLYRQHSRH